MNSSFRARALATAIIALALSACAAPQAAAPTSAPAALPPPHRDTLLREQDMRRQISAFSLNSAVHHEGERALLLVALFVVVWLRLALPAINFGQPMFYEMQQGGMMPSMHQVMDDQAAAGDAHAGLPTDQRCRDAMPGCDAYLQGMCSLAPVFVLAVCAALVAPAVVQAAPPSLSARDLSPLREAPKQPPRP